MPVRSPLLPVLVLALLAVSGCAGAGPVFDNEGGRQVQCLRHQAEPPGTRYTDAETRDTAALFTVLRYYTAHGTKAYCDGAPPTDADRAWAEFYSQQTGNRTKVAPILDAEG